MKRAFICAAIALSVAVVASAQQPRPGAGQPGQPRPGQPAQPGATAQFMQGSIVSVDPTGNTITLRTGTAATAREQQFRVNESTKFFGTDRQPLTDGLRFNGMKPGTDVWYQAGTGANASMISNLSLFNPSSRPGAGGANRDRENPNKPDKDE
jgi:hypothetical protein